MLLRQRLRLQLSAFAGANAAIESIPVVLTNVVSIFTPVYKLLVLTELSKR